MGPARAHIHTSSYRGMERAVGVQVFRNTGNTGHRYNGIAHSHNQALPGGIRELVGIIIIGSDIHGVATIAADVGPSLGFSGSFGLSLGLSITVGFSCPLGLSESFALSLGFSGSFAFSLGVSKVTTLGFFSGSLDFSGSLGLSPPLGFSGSLGFAGSLISMLLIAFPPLQHNLSRILSGLQQTTRMVIVLAFSSYI
uniref:Uncharacterized protein n=1 Tax=Solanum tuberosum TaxID=4113 RepID=Q2XTD1_SOLTU|nr:unknown [Solanum tuberosum]